MQKIKSVENGQTLAEIVVVIGVVMLLVTGLVIGATASLKAAQFSRSKTLAVGYAQEAVELSRTLRDESWSNFLTYANNGGKWCLGETNSWTPSPGVCLINIKGVYRRSVDFSWVDPKMKVDVTVSWSDSIGTYQTKLSTYFTEWR